MPDSDKTAIKAIAAMSINRVIGDAGEIPWHLPRDFQWFRECTLGQTVVMGRKTLESIGKPLPNRRTVLVSRSARPGEYPGVTVVREIEQIPEVDAQGDIWICGGAEIYEQTLPLCNELFLTVVKRKVRGDTFFPEFQHLFGRPEIIREEEDMVIYRFLPLQ